MKKGFKNINILIFFIMFMFGVSIGKVTAKEHYNNVSSFLEFEKKIMELNKSVFDEGNYVLESNTDSEKLEKFALKRLIVQGNLKDTYNAKDIITYNNLHILTYRSSQETEIAYNELKKDHSLAVISDEIKSIEEYGEKEYDYSGYRNWGAESIDIGGYRQYLIDNRVTREVVVVVLDTGINTSHKLFEGRLLRDGNGKVRGFSYYNSEYQYSYKSLGFDVDNPNTPLVDEGDSDKYSFEDDRGHGSHVAGIIAELTPSNVKILPIKISDKDGFSTNTIMIAAYLRVIQIYSKQYQVVATNLSFSGGGKSDNDQRDIFNEQCYNPLLELNILPVTAAGNESERIDIVGLNAVVVSALEKTPNGYLFDREYSNYGAIIDISAPGSGIVSAGIAETDKAERELMIINTGTSMASPQVAAIAALLYLNPSDTLISANDVEKALYEYAIDFNNDGKDGYYGYGMLNLRYFESEEEGELYFYKDDLLIENLDKVVSYVDNFKLAIKAPNEKYKIIYTLDRSLPTMYNHIEYTGELSISENTYINVMAIVVVDDNIVYRSEVYRLTFFDDNSSLEEYFSIDEWGNIFEYTGNFKELVIPSVIKGITVKRMNPSLFKDSSLERVTLPETLESLPGYVFQYSKNLKYVYGPNIKKIYIAAFSDCDSITFVSSEHPKDGTTEGVYLPALEETIGFSFSNNINLVSVSLPNLKIMGENGHDFYNCPKLKSVSLPSITTISKGAFRETKNLTQTFYISPLLESIGELAFYNSGIKGFVVDKENRFFYSDGYGIYSKEGLIAFATGAVGVNYTILDKVMIQSRMYNITTIVKGAMATTNIGELVISPGITRINGAAFIYSSIDVLYYNAKNVTHEGYYDKEEMSVSRVFTSIGRIVIGKDVISVPERLFQRVNFDELIINSMNTNLKSCSFYRLEGQGDLSKLVFNFTGKITLDYIKQVSETEISNMYSSIKRVYSRSEISISDLSYMQSFKYVYKEGDYYVYTSIAKGMEFEITSKASVGGSITPKASVYVEAGGSIKYTITMDEHYKIKYIKVDGENLSSSTFNQILEKGYTFDNVSSDHSIEVVFEKLAYYVEIETHSYGYVTPNFAKVEHGDNFTFSIYPATGYTIDKIYINDSVLSEDEIEGIRNRGGYTLINVTNHTDIRVTFKLKLNKLKSSFEGEGYISPEGEIEVSKGGSISFIFRANEGFEIVDIIIDGVSIPRDEFKVLKESGVYTFENVENNHSIKVVAEKIKYTIFASVYGNGTISPPGIVEVEHGGSVTFEFEAAKESHIEDICIGNTCLSKEEVERLIFTKKYTFTNVVEDSSIEIFIKQDVYTIRAEFEGNGFIYPSGDVEVAYKGRQFFNFYADDRYEITEIIINGVMLEGEEFDDALALGYTFKSVEQDCSIKVIANRIKHVIEASSIGYDAIVPSGKIVVEDGNDQEFKIDVKFGYHIENIFIGSVALSRDEIDSLNNTYTFRNVMNSESIVVVMAKNVYHINATFDGEGYIEPKGDVEVIFDESMKFNFVPAKGYEIASIFIDGVAMSEEEVETTIKMGYIFNKVDTDHSIKIKSIKGKYTVEASSVGYGAIEPKGKMILEYGDVKMFNIIPLEGYHVERLYVGGVSLSKDMIEDALTNGYLLKEVSEDTAIRVIFESNDYVIRTTAKGEGEISPNKEISLKKGENQLFEFTPNIGSYIKDVKVNGVSKGALNEYEVSNIFMDQEIEVIFAKYVFAIEVETLGKGTFVSKDDLREVEFGSDVSINVIPQEGYVVDKVWLDTEEVKIEDNILVISNIQDNHKVTITFKEENDKQEDDINISVSGMSCSKNKEGGSAMDFLFIVFTILGIALPRKKFF